jgi:uncharacterized protein
VGRLFVGVLGLVVLLLGLLWVFQRSLVFLPTGAPGVGPEVLPGGTAARFRTADGLDLTAWHAPPTGDARDVTVLVLPGNGGSRVDRIPLARALTAAGFAVLLVDYRGYGGNPGSPSEEGLAEDARAAHRHLVDDRGVPAERIVLFGESLGGAVATWLALERPVAGLVLRSPFASLTDVAARVYPVLPVRLLLRDRFPLVERAPGLPGPTVVLASAADELVPAEQSRAVAAAAGAEYVELEGLGHNAPGLSHGPEVVAAVQRVAPP